MSAEALPPIVTLLTGTPMRSAYPWRAAATGGSYSATVVRPCAQRSSAVLIASATRPGGMPMLAVLRYPVGMSKVSPQL